ncbi:MAG: hypothetical protein PHP39_00880 [Oscillospiraceae bacterium]|nr:hypothetical protein [Oscillospiraceae bacterium]
MIVFIIPDVQMKKWMLDEAGRLIQKLSPDQIVCLGDLADDFGLQHDPHAYEVMFGRAVR